MAELGAIQPRYAKEITSMQRVSYWVNMKMYHFYSLERKSYIWKFLEREEVSISIESYSNNRSGPHLIFPELHHYDRGLDTAIAS